MTFSHQKVVELIRKRFVPAWESVAPVSIAVFDLGDGGTVRGTMSGEIALYFCRPDGKVFDILPGLHSPQLTLHAMNEALAFYDATGATDEAVQTWHQARLAALGPEGQSLSLISRKARGRLAARRDSDVGTKALATMSLSKTSAVDFFPVDGTREYSTVVDLGGVNVYRRRVHETFARQRSLLTTYEWKKDLFERILEQELKGGEVRIGADDLVPVLVNDD